MAGIILDVNLRRLTVQIVILEELIRDMFGGVVPGAAGNNMKWNARSGSCSYSAFPKLDSFERI